MRTSAPWGRGAGALLALVLLALTPGGAAAASPHAPAAQAPQSQAHQAQHPTQPATALPAPRAENDADLPPVRLDDVTPERLETGDDLSVTVTLTPTEAVEESALNLILDPSIAISRSQLFAWQAQTEPLTAAPATTVELDDPIDAGESVTVEIEATAEELGLGETADWGPRGLQVLLTSGDEVVGQTRTVIVLGEPESYFNPLPVSLVVPATAQSIGVDGLSPGLGPSAGSDDDGQGSADESPSDGGEPPDDDAQDSATDAPGAGDAGTTTTDEPSGDENPTDEDGEDTAGAGSDVGQDGDETDGDATNVDPGAEGVEAGAAAAAQGAVEHLADGLAGTGATLALDPVLLEGAAGGQDTPLADLAADSQLLALPSGDADLAALAHVGRTELARELTTRAVDRIGELTGHVVPSLAWPATDSPDARTVELAADVDASVVLLPGDALDPEVPIAYTPSGRADLLLDPDASTAVPALVTEGRLEAALAGTMQSWTDDSELEISPAQASQLVLADLAVILRERPSDPRPQVLSFDRSTTLDADAAIELAEALGDAPWVEMTAPDELLALEDSGVDREPLPDEVVGAGEVTARDLQVAEEVEESAGVVRTMTATPPAIVESASQAVRMAASAGWRDDPTARDDLLRGWRESLSSATGAVHAEPTSPINLIAASADLPVHVVNDGDFDAQVYVVIDPDDPRLVAPEPVPLTVPAGGSATAQVAVEAIGSGDLPVAIRLLTSDGRQIGGEETIVVRVRAGWEGYGVAVVGILLAVLFVAGLVKRIRRGVRVPTRERTPVIAGDPGAPTEHVVEESADSADSPDGADTPDRAENSPDVTDTLDRAEDSPEATATPDRPDTLERPRPALPTEPPNQPDDPDSPKETR
ncbi:MAG: DUF6049 family protein [Actinomycetaceae bacterium]